MAPRVDTLCGLLAIVCAFMHQSVGSWRSSGLTFVMPRCFSAVAELHVRFWWNNDASIKRDIDQICTGHLSQYWVAGRFIAGRFITGRFNAVDSSRGRFIRRSIQHRSIHHKNCYIL